MARAGERRTVHLGVQLTPTERAELELAAAEAGTSLSQYVRELCLRRAAEAATVGGARRNPEASLAACQGSDDGGACGWRLRDAEGIAT
jgi:hypothetical protein